MTTATASPLMLDWLLPEFDATVVEHRVIESDPESVYRARRASTWPRSRRLTRRFACCSPPAAPPSAWLNALLGRPTPEMVPDGPLRLGDMPDHGDWVKLAADPPEEFAFGVIGRFWGGETVWETIDADHFVAFDEPGLAKIACSISVRPYGSARTLVSYEARTQALDPESRTHFLRYWRMVRPGVAIVMRAFLGAVAKEVQ